MNKELRFAGFSRGAPQDIGRHGILQVFLLTNVNTEYACS